MCSCHQEKKKSNYLRWSCRSFVIIETDVSSWYLWGLSYHDKTGRRPRIFWNKPCRRSVSDKTSWVRWWYLVSPPANWYDGSLRTWSLWGAYHTRQDPYFCPHILLQEANRAVDLSVWPRGVSLVVSRVVSAVVSLLPRNWCQSVNSCWAYHFCTSQFETRNYCPRILLQANRRPIAIIVVAVSSVAEFRWWGCRVETDVIPCDACVGFLYLV